MLNFTLHVYTYAAATSLEAAIWNMPDNNDDNSMTIIFIGIGCVILGVILYLLFGTNLIIDHDSPTPTPTSDNPTPSTTPSNDNTTPTPTSDQDFPFKDGDIIKLKSLSCNSDLSNNYLSGCRGTDRKGVNIGYDCGGDETSLKCAKWTVNIIKDNIITLQTINDVSGCNTKYLSGCRGKNKKGVDTQHPCNENNLDDISCNYWIVEIVDNKTIKLKSQNKYCIKGNSYLIGCTSNENKKFIAYTDKEDYKNSSKWEYEIL